MAVTRVSYNAATIGGALVAEGVDHLRKGRECLERAVSMANSVCDGGLTPALLEASTEFGVATAKGSAFYTALGNMKTNSATGTDAAIADLDMGS